MPAGASDPGWIVIQFNITGSWTGPVNMSYNATSKYYEYNRTFDEIGSYLGLSLETVSRLFSRFQEDGLISVQGLVPETRQFTANFQQFLTAPMTLRFVPGGADSPTSLNGKKSLTVNADVIQGRFDYISHDGSLPGTDSRKVAAISRLLELVPLVPQYFQPAAGNIDARALILAGAKAAGLNVENFQFKEDQLAAAPPAPGLDPSAAPPAPGSPEEALAGLTGAPAVPPPVMPEGPGPGRPPTPSMTEIPSADPLQIRPNQL